MTLIFSNSTTLHGFVIPDVNEDGVVNVADYNLADDAFVPVAYENSDEFVFVAASGLKNLLNADMNHSSEDNCVVQLKASKPNEQLPDKLPNLVESLLEWVDLGINSDKVFNLVLKLIENYLNSIPEIENTSYNYIVAALNHLDNFVQNHILSEESLSSLGKLFGKIADKDTDALIKIIRDFIPSRIEKIKNGQADYANGILEAILPAQENHTYNQNIIDAKKVAIDKIYLQFSKNLFAKYPQLDVEYDDNPYLISQINWFASDLSWLEGTPSWLSGAAITDEELNRIKIEAMVVYFVDDIQKAIRSAHNQSISMVDTNFKTTINSIPAQSWLVLPVRDSASDPYSDTIIARRAFVFLNRFGLLMNYEAPLDLTNKLGIYSDDTTGTTVRVFFKLTNYPSARSKNDISLDKPVIDGVDKLYRDSAFKWHEEGKIFNLIHSGKMNPDAPLSEHYLPEKNKISYQEILYEISEGDWEPLFKQANSASYENPSSWFILKKLAYYIFFESLEKGKNIYECKKDGHSDRTPHSHNPTFKIDESHMDNFLGLLKKIRDEQPLAKKNLETYYEFLARMVGFQYLCLLIHADDSLDRARIFNESTNKIEKMSPSFWQKAFDSNNEYDTAKLINVYNPKDNNEQLIGEHVRAILEKRETDFYQTDFMKKIDELKSAQNSFETKLSSTLAAFQETNEKAQKTLDELYTKVQTYNELEKTMEQQTENQPFELSQDYIKQRAFSILKAVGTSLSLEIIHKALSSKEGKASEILTAFIDLNSFSADFDYFNVNILSKWNAIKETIPKFNKSGFSSEDLKEQCKSFITAFHNNNLEEMKQILKNVDTKISDINFGSEKISDNLNSLRSLMSVSYSVCAVKVTLKNIAARAQKIVQKSQEYFQGLTKLLEVAGNSDNLFEIVKKIQDKKTGFPHMIQISSEIKSELDAIKSDVDFLVNEKIFDQIQFIKNLTTIDLPLLKDIKEKITQMSEKWLPNLIKIYEKINLSSYEKKIRTLLGIQ